MVVIDDDKNATSTISNEAYELLGFFTGGIDNLVYDLAEKIARKRNPNLKLVPIETEDIKTAARMVIQSFKQLDASGELPEGMEQEIDDMNQCLEENMQST